MLMRISDRHMDGQMATKPLQILNLNADTDTTIWSTEQIQIHGLALLHPPKTSETLDIAFYKQVGISFCYFVTICSALRLLTR